MEAPAEAVEKMAYFRWLLVFGIWAACNPRAMAFTAPGDAPSERQTRVVSPRSVAGGSGLEARILREINDPCTGRHWLLMRDRLRPGGPGRLVPLSELQGQESLHNGRRVLRDASHPEGSGPDSYLPAIRAGDLLVVEEHTPVMDAYLEAVAFGSATVGSEFDARLKIGGRMVRAVAIARGRAMLRPRAGERP